MIVVSVIDRQLGAGLDIVLGNNLPTGIFRVSVASKSTVGPGSWGVIYHARHRLQAFLLLQPLQLGCVVPLEACALATYSYGMCCISVTGVFLTELLFCVFLSAHAVICNDFTSVDPLFGKEPKASYVAMADADLRVVVTLWGILAGT